MTTAPTHATTITLPVPPVAKRYTLTLAPVLSPLQRAWLTARERSDSAGDRRDWQDCDAAQEDEDRAEAALAAAGEPLPTGPAFAPVCVEVDASVALRLMGKGGPALQWEHMSPTARAATTAAIAALAHANRVDAATWRVVGNVESALAAEGRALGLEAAVAVLGRV